VPFSLHCCILPVGRLHHWTSELSLQLVKFELNYKLKTEALNIRTCLTSLVWVDVNSWVSCWCFTQCVCVCVCVWCQIHVAAELIYVSWQHDIWQLSLVRMMLCCLMQYMFVQSLLEIRWIMCAVFVSSICLHITCISVQLYRCVYNWCLLAGMCITVSVWKSLLNIIRLSTCNCTIRCF